ncbi:hypothetical protein RJ639_028296 [Escallonia herrerae]|uniref:Uncharacterized protein n=1 Tax=Escallonia herrerae TaxID=1293975 RepID=A0AA88X5D2_9ASTE|nr:hypothetical protein RJ639_028296 [Escallonia herrerae]
MEVSYGKDIHGPFASLMMTYIFNAMTHLAIDVRLMAFKYFDLVLRYYPTSFSMYAEKILQNYEDILRKNQFYLQDKGKLKSALARLAHCLSLLPSNKRDDDSAIKKDAATRRILHAFEPDAPKDHADSPSPKSNIHQRPKEHNTTSQFLSRMYNAHLLERRFITSLDQITLIYEIRKRKPQIVIRAEDFLLPKEDDRYFILNVIITEIFFCLSDWIHPALLEKFLEFIESALSNKISSCTQSGKAFPGKHSLSLISSLPKLIMQVAVDWKPRILEVQLITQTNESCVLKERRFSLESGVYLISPGVLTIPSNILARREPLLVTLQRTSLPINKVPMLHYFLFLWVIEGATSSSSSSPSGSSTENNLESDSESRSSQVGTSTFRSQVGTSTLQTSTSFRRRDALGEIKDEAEDRFDEDTWFAADEKRNKMTKESIVELLKEYPLPPPFSARVPALQEPANYGTNLETSVYEGQIRSGYRVPMHPFAVAFFNHYKMAPGQLVPNGWRKLVGLIYLVQTSGYPVTVDDFMRLYLEVCFIKSVAKGDGWYYIHNRIRVIKGGPKSNKGWHCRYFFIQRPSGKWEFPRKWNGFCKDFEKDGFLSPNAVTKKLPDHIKRRGVLNIDEPLTDQEMRHARLIPPASDTPVSPTPVLEPRIISKPKAQDPTIDTSSSRTPSLGRV